MLAHSANSAPLAYSASALSADSKSAPVDYAVSLFDPFTAPPTYPDGAPDPRNTKAIYFNATLSGSTNYMLLFTPHSNNVLRVFNSVTDGAWTNPTTITPSQNLFTDFAKYRSVTSGLRISSATIASGLFSVAGQIYAINARDPFDQINTSSSNLVSYAATDVDVKANVLLADGLTVLGPPNPTGDWNDPRSFYSYGKELVFSTQRRWSTASGNPVSSNTNLGTVDISQTPGWKATGAVVAGLPQILYDSTLDAGPGIQGSYLPYGCAGRFTIEIDVCGIGNYGVNETGFISLTVNDSIPGGGSTVLYSQDVILIKTTATNDITTWAAKYTFTTLTPVGNIKLGVGTTGAATLGIYSGSLKVTNWDIAVPGRMSNFSQIIITGVNAAQTIQVAGLVNYEVIPNFTLAKNMKLTNGSGDPRDLYLANQLYLNRASLNLAGVFTNREYEQFLSRLRQEAGLFQRDSLERIAHTFSFGDVWRGVKGLVRKAAPALISNYVPSQFQPVVNMGMQRLGLAQDAYTDDASNTRIAYTMDTEQEEEMEHDVCEIAAMYEQYEGTADYKEYFKDWMEPDNPLCMCEKCYEAYLRIDALGELRTTHPLMYFSKASDILVSVQATTEHLNQPEKLYPNGNMHLKIQNADHYVHVALAYLLSIQEEDRYTAGQPVTFEASDKDPLYDEVKTGRAYRDAIMGIALQYLNVREVDKETLRKLAKTGMGWFEHNSLYSLVPQKRPAQDPKKIAYCMDPPAPKEEEKKSERFILAAKYVDGGIQVLYQALNGQMWRVIRNPEDYEYFGQKKMQAMVETKALLPPLAETSSADIASIAAQLKSLTEALNQITQSLPADQRKQLMTPLISSLQRSASDAAPKADKLDDAFFPSTNNQAMVLDPSRTYTFAKQLAREILAGSKPVLAFQSAQGLDQFYLNMAFCPAVVDGVAHTLKILVTEKPFKTIWLTPTRVKYEDINGVHVSDQFSPAQKQFFTYLNTDKVRGKWFTVLNDVAMLGRSCEAAIWCAVNEYPPLFAISATVDFVESKGENRAVEFGVVGGVQQKEDILNRGFPFPLLFGSREPFTLDFNSETYQKLKSMTPATYYVHSPNDLGVITLADDTSGQRTSKIEQRIKSQMALNREPANSQELVDEMEAAGAPPVMIQATKGITSAVRLENAREQFYKWKAARGGEQKGGGVPVTEDAKAAYDELAQMRPSDLPANFGGSFMSKLNAAISAGRGPESIIQAADSWYKRRLKSAAGKAHFQSNFGASANRKLARKRGDLFGKGGEVIDLD